MDEAEKRIMGLWDIVLLGITFAMLAIAAYLFVNELNVQNVEYKEFVAETTLNVSGETNQFYPNMRFTTKDLGYMIESVCSEANKLKIIEGLDEIKSRTIVSFHPSNDPDIIYECSSKSPTAEEKKNHLVAGAARPRFVNASRFYIIRQTNVSLYIEESCKRPIVVIHETLHALGFDHVNDKNDIMYPIADCNQQISNYTINEINRLYSIPEQSDLVILKITANTTGRYLNFNISVANLGLKDAENVNLTIFNEKHLIEIFGLDDIGTGQTKLLDVHNLNIPKESVTLTFSAKNGESADLHPDDNYAYVTAKPE